MLNAYLVAIPIPNLTLTTTVAYIPKVRLFHDAPPSAPVLLIPYNATCPAGPSKATSPSLLLIPHFTLPPPSIPNKLLNPSPPQKKERKNPMLLTTYTPIKGTLHASFKKRCVLYPKARLLRAYIPKLLPHQVPQGVPNKALPLSNPVSLNSSPSFRARTGFSSYRLGTLLKQSHQSTPGVRSIFPDLRT